MGKGSSPSVAMPDVSGMQTEVVTPAIAKTIARDTASAQQQQLAARQRMRGISSTYMRGNQLASGQTGTKSKLGE